MGFEVTDEIKNNGEKTQRGYSILNILLGIVMLVIGLKHLPPTADPAASTISEVSAASEESDPCPNGTAYYLYVAGIILLVANLVGIVTKVAQYLAERDGKISCGEACGLGLLNCASGVLVVAEIVMLFWGSVIVFGAWATWTYDYEKYAAAPEELNYCAYQPMMLAFVLLILKWVLIPAMVVLTCCCGCLFAPCGGKTDSTEQTA